MPTKILQRWLEQYVPGRAVQIVDYGQADKDCICVSLADVTATDRNLSPRRDGLRVCSLRLTYRVTAPFAPPQDGHRVLCDIVYATLENPIAQGLDDTLTQIVMLDSALALNRFGPQQGAGLYLELLTQRVTRIPPSPPVLERPDVVAGPTRPGT